MNIALPSALAAAIAQNLEGVSRKELAARAEAFSAAYRSGGTSRVLGDRMDILAYLVARLPATYASVKASFDAVCEAFPDFAPASVLDVGAGTGAASWAARETWPALETISMLDHNSHFLDMARVLASASENRALAGANISAGELGSIGGQPKADLVVASYVLAEQPEERAAAIARDLWANAAAMLVVVEPGTPAGFARIRSVRGTLIGEGAHVAAPCTHNNPCPMKAPDWCHFTQRLPRSRDHRIAKDAQVPFEDERYSYIALSREAPQPTNRARIIAAPEEDKAGITFPICDDHGLHRGVILRRDRAVFNMMRKAGWGDVIVSED